MSVPLHRRKTSIIQFIDTAQELHKHTILSCSKFPKSLTFSLTTFITSEAASIVASVAQVNVVRPNSMDNIQRRRHYIHLAQGSLDTLSAYLSTARKLQAVILTDAAWRIFGELIEKERRLLHSLLKSDKQVVF